MAPHAASLNCLRRSTVCLKTLLYFLFTCRYKVTPWCHPGVGTVPPVLATGKNGGIVQSFQPSPPFQCFKQELVPLAGSVRKCVGGAFLIITVSEGLCWYSVTSNDRYFAMWEGIQYNKNRPTVDAKSNPPPWHSLSILKSCALQQLRQETTEKLASSCKYGHAPRACLPLEKRLII